MDPKNQLTNATPVGTQTYDGNGNVTASGSANYVYDDENRLIEYTASSKTAFTYDGLGRMRKRIEYVWTGSSWYPNETIYYHYDGMRVIQERGSTPQVSYTRGSDLSGSLEGAGGIGGLLARSHAYQSGSGNFTNHNCYHADGNGNITYLVNSSQTLAASYRYDPFGNTISSSGTLASANVYRFSSKEFHVNSGLYYYGYRFYSPTLQRWLNRHPIEERGGINLYGIVRNNAVCEVDPFGYVLFGPPELGQPGPKPPPSPSDPEPGWEWLPKEGPLKFCRKGQRRDCDMAMAFCIGRGQLFCSVVGPKSGLGGAAYRFCMSVYASACYVQRSQCQSWNIDNGFSP